MLRLFCVLWLFAAVLSFEIAGPAAASGFIVKAAEPESEDAGGQLMKSKACKQLLNLMKKKSEDLDCKNKPDDGKCQNLEKAIEKKEEQCGD